MNVILYMATTPNGMIATTNDETPWLETEWESFRAIVERTGNIIVGRRTYEIMKHGGEIEKIGNPLVVIVSSHGGESTAALIDTVSDNCVGVTSPQTALAAVKAKGMQEALVAGGGELNGSFMQAGLVNELYCDIEPVVFGQGVPLFGNVDFQAQLEFVSAKNISKSEIQLHYRVLSGIDDR